MSRSDMYRPYINLNRGPCKTINSFRASRRIVFFVSFDIHFKEGETYEQWCQRSHKSVSDVLQMGTQRQLFLDKLDSAGLELVHLNGRLK